LKSAVTINVQTDVSLLGYKPEKVFSIRHVALQL